jgi:hypothetical protein
VWGDSVIYANPSATFFGIPNIETVSNTLSTFHRKNGIANTEEGEKDRFVKSYKRPEDISDVPYSELELILRGEMIFEEKETLHYDEPIDIIKPYFFKYYIMNTSEGLILVIVSKKSVVKWLYLALRDMGINILPIRFNRPMQDRIIQRRDMTNCSKRVHDETEDDVGSIEVKGRSTTASVRATQIGRQIDSRGELRDMTFTWDPQVDRHRLTFHLKHQGSFNVLHPQVKEDWILQIVDLVIGVL